MKAHTMRNKFEAFNKEFSKRMAIAPAEQLVKVGHDPKQWEIHIRANPFLADGKWKAKEAYVDAINDRVYGKPTEESQPTHWTIQFWTKEGHVVMTNCGLEDDRFQITNYCEDVLNELGIDIRHIARCKV